MKQGLLIAALGFFLLWSVVTWFFEGRLDTLLRPEAIVDRVVYAFIVNLLLGIGGGIWFLRYWKQRGALDMRKTGFRHDHRTVISIVVGVGLGSAGYVLQGAPSRELIVIVNAFAQVLPVSTAEVIVCWSVVAVATESALASHGSAVSVAVAAVVASVLFGIYHYAHSPPFNTFPKVALLSVVGLATSAFYFISRDVAGTVVFHNFLGTFGVVHALADANALTSLQELQVSLVVTALVTAALLVIGYVVLTAHPTHLSGTVSPAGFRKERW